MIKIFDMLETHFQSIIEERVDQRIKNKYRNVFHLDDAFYSEPLDKYLLPKGQLAGLEARIKADRANFQLEETESLYNKIIKLFEKQLEEKKEEKK